MRKTKVVTATKGANATKVAVGAAEKRRVAIKPLDPIRKCGPGTSVQFLYRVDESVDGRITAHLVFFDRHGWYCEHGRTCPAVGHEEIQRADRASFVASSHWTDNETVG